MAGHSRPKDGVAPARLCPAIHVCPELRDKTRGYPAARTSLRSLRKTDYYARA